MPDLQSNMTSIGNDVNSDTKEVYVEICNPEKTNWRCRDKNTQARPGNWITKKRSQVCTGMGYRFGNTRSRERSRTNSSKSDHGHQSYPKNLQSESRIERENDKSLGWMLLEAFMDCPPSHVNGNIFHKILYVSSSSDDFCGRCLTSGHKETYCEQWKTSRCFNASNCRKRQCMDAHPGETQRRMPHQSNKRCSMVIECQGKQGTRLIMILGCQMDDHIIDGCPKRALQIFESKNAPESPTCDRMGPYSPEYKPTSPSYVPNDKPPYSPEYAPTSPSYVPNDKSA